MRVEPTWRGSGGALLLLLACAALTPTPSRAADQHGLVVRVSLGDTPAGGAVVVHLASEAEEKDVPVLDDGKNPDVTGGDGVYSGTTWLAGDTLDVSVSVGATKVEGGKVSWSATETTRDLTLTVAGGALTAEAGVPAAAPPGTDPNAPAPTPAEPGSAVATDPGAGGAGGAPTGQAVPPTRGSPSPSGPPESAAASGDAALYVGFGIGILLLAGVVYLGSRGRSRASALPSLPEPGVLGPGTPSPSDGLSVWEVATVDAPALTDALLATLARHHRVMLVADPDWSPARVHGGPVYRSPSHEPRALQNALDDLAEEGGLPIVALLTRAMDAQRLAALAEALPDGVGGLVVHEGAGDTALPVVQCHREGDLWTFTTREATVRCSATPDGLVPDDRAGA